MSPRPQWLPRRPILDNDRCELDCDVPPDASRTFAPTKRERCLTAVYWVVAWLSLGSGILASWPQ